MDLQNEIVKIDDAISNMKHRINEALNIQQNPDITVLNDSPRCYTIPFSKLSSTSILSPKFYDFELQKDLISAMIENSNPNQILPKLQKIIETEFLPNNAIKSGDKILKSSNERIRINPTVIDCIKKVIEQ